MSCEDCSCEPQAVNEWHETAEPVEYKFLKWAQELASATNPLASLQDDIEYYAQNGDAPIPRPELIRAQVKMAQAMLPLIKTILAEMQNWPDDPVPRKTGKKTPVA